MTKKQQAELERVNVFEQLSEICKPGTTIYTILRHVSRSGMCRHITFHIIRDNYVQNITYWVGAVLGLRQHKDGGLIVGGCGMDMGYHVVNSLSYALHGYKPHGHFVCLAHEDGRPFTPTETEYRPGYSLKHQWL